jgi:hypothetical protein
MYKKVFCPDIEILLQSMFSHGILCSASIHSPSPCCEFRDATGSQVLRKGGQIGVRGNIDAGSLESHDKSSTTRSFLGFIVPEPRSDLTSVLRSSPDL